MKYWSKFGVLAALLISASLSYPETSSAAYGLQSVANLGGKPVQMVFAPDGRLFFTDQCVGVKVRSTNGTINTFRSLSPSCDSEQGAIGITLDPDFGKNLGNDWVYVHYSVNGSTNRVVRFKTGSDGLQTLIDISTPNAGNHNGGSILFGNDGKLYITQGDDHQFAPAQSTTNRIGKILRINKDGSIPTDNPFGAGNPVWAYGLRNPFTMAVNPNNGRIYVNDVGEGAVEEINQLAKGANYGWNICEGSCGNSGMTNPLYQYYHAGAGGRSSPDGESITGGAFWNGKYFFSDFAGTWSGTYTNGWIGVRNESTGATQIQILAYDMPVGMAVNPADSQLYVVGYGGQLSRITDTDAPPSSPTNTTAPATPTVPTVPNSAPNITITSPSPSLLYAGGDVINASATASDPEDGTLSGNSIQWKVDFYHYNVAPTNFHVHPFLDWSGIPRGTSMSFTISNNNEFVPTVWYRITARATDSKGATAEKYVDIQPLVVNQTFTSNPTGLTYLINSFTQTTPFTTSTVAGLKFSLLATSPQLLTGTNYQFASWSDNSSTTPLRDYFIPKTNSTLTARYTTAITTPASTTTPQNSPTVPPVNSNDTILGLSSVGNFEDMYNAGYITGSQITTGSGNPSATKASIYIGAVDAAPNNQFQIAIYSDQNNAPGTFIAKSQQGTLVANTWNTLPLTTTLQPNTKYWLLYSTNSNNAIKNNMKYQLVTNNQGIFSSTPQTFGTWPTTLSVIKTPAIYSLYALVTGATAPQNTPIPTNTSIPNPTSTSAPLPTTPPTTTTGNDYVIYTDALSSGWSAWNWNGQVNTASLNQFGNNSISLTPSSTDSGLYLRKTGGSSVDGSNFEYLEFSMKSGPSTPLNIRVSAYGSNTNPPFTAGVPLSNYGGNPPTSTYKTYKIPLADMGAAGKAIYGFSFQELNDPSAIFFVDSIRLTSSKNATLYTNSLASGWSAWNWSATINLSSLNQFGNNSISVTPNANDAGVYLRKTSGNGLSTTGYTHLQFKMKSGPPDPVNIRIFTYGSATNPPLNSGFNLSAAGGNPPTDTYRTYTIPLSSLNATNTSLYGVAFQILDSSPSIVYIDEVKLVNQ